MGQQRRLAPHRTGKVTGQVGHRQLQTTVRPDAPDAAIVHPGTSLFGRAGIQIQIKARDQLAASFNIIGGNVRVPGGDSGGLGDFQVKQAGNYFKHTQNHLGCWKVRSQLLFGNAELAVFELLAVKGQIPGL